MPLKTFSALSSTTSFFLPLGILNSPQNLSKLRGSLQGSAYVSAAVERLEPLGYALILNGLWQADTPIPTNDIWIAGPAMEDGLSVVTNDDDYQKIPDAIIVNSASYEKQTIVISHLLFRLRRIKQLINRA